MRHLIRLFLVLAVLVPAPLLAQDDTSPSGTITAEADDATDAVIAVRIREILAELGGYEDVTVTVSNGIVTLRGTTASLPEVEALDRLVVRVEGVVAIKNEVTETTDIVRRLNPAMERFEARLMQLITALPLLLIAGAAFLVVFLVGYAISGFSRLWERLAPNSFIAGLYSQIVMIVFVVGGVVIALDILNASALLGTILGAAGIFGLAIGFAVRDTVENYIASIMLSIRQPFRPNDTIEINGDEGKVIRLTSRATILLSFDGNHIRIPNATVFKSRIVNYTQNAERRFKFSLYVGPDADLGRAREVASETVAALPYVIAEPAAQSWIEGITDRGVEIVVTGWIDQRETSLVRAKGEALRLVKLALRGAGIALFDGSLVVHMEGEGREAPARSAHGGETRAVAQVAAETESSLEKMIEAERETSETEDFLTEAAKKE
jgi:small-conductance mechanosensitive channel